MRLFFTRREKVYLQQYNRSQTIYDRVTAVNDSGNLQRRKQFAASTFVIFFDLVNVNRFHIIKTTEHHFK